MSRSADQQISRAAVRARGLVQQILAFSRRQPLRLVNQPMRPLVEDAARLRRSILPAGAALDVALTDAPIHVAADATQLHQVLMNLCTNAWHAHNGQAGRITVGLDRARLQTVTNAASRPFARRRNRT